MRLWHLLLIACLPAGLFAAGKGAATTDPFAVYHGAIESRLSAMLDGGQATVPQAAGIPPYESVTPPAPSKDIEIRDFARRFWGGRDPELAGALERLERLRPRLGEILRAEGVPEELVAVVLVESGAQPFALSPRRARGLWQLIPETAQQYGLTVSGAKDERIDLESATRAAASYLRDLYSRFGDWPLALAAYNAGQKAVADALEKGRAGTFWQLRSAGLLPAETRNYVPAVLAAMRLIASKKPAAPAQAVRPSATVYASVGSPN